MFNPVFVARFASTLRHHMWAIVMIAGLVLWSGWPAVSHVFGYNDDYHLLLRARRGELDWFRNEFSEGGRYLLSPVMVFAYRSAQNVAHLAWMRAFGLLGTLVLALCFYAILFRETTNRVSALAGALLAALTPATATWLGWAACLVFPFVAALSLIVGRWTWSCLKAPWGWPTLAKVFVSVGLLLLAYSLYQPNGPYWIVGFWMGYWGETRRAPADASALNATARLRANLAILAGPFLLILAAALYFLLFQTLAESMHLQGQVKRGAMSIGDLPGKLLWLGKAYTPRVFAHWAGLVSPLVAQITAFALGVVAIVGILLRRKRPTVAGILGDTVVIFGVFLLSLLPMVAASDRMIAFRVMGPPLVVLAVILWKCIRNAAEALNVGQAGSWLLVMLSLGNVILFRIYLDHGFVRPSSQEYHALKAQVAERVETFPSNLVYRFPPEQVASTAYFRPTAEFGTYSSYQKWVIPSLLQLILEEQFGRDQPRVVVRTLADPASEHPAPVISALEAVTGPPLEHKIDPYWGPIDVHKQGWIYSEWFGVLNNVGFPEIKHAEHHYLRCIPREDGDETYWFLDWQTNRWFSTTAETYPKVYFLDTKETAVYSPIVAPLRSFWDEKDKKWIVFF